MCQFVYCLLSRTRKTVSLPELNNWEENIDEQRVDESENVAASDFLHNHSFGTVLPSREDSDGRAFRELCMKFMDRLVDALLAQQSVTEEFSCGLYAFCPELLFCCWRATTIVCWSSSENCSMCWNQAVVSQRWNLELRTAVEEYSTFVVDA